MSLSEEKMDCRPPSRGERELEDQEEVEEEGIHPVALEPDASLPEEPLQNPSPLQSLDEVSRTPPHLLWTLCIVLKL